MLILGVDTSGKNVSIALVECGPGASRTIDVASLEGGTFSAQLVPQIAALLQKHGFTKQQIDGFAVVTGPGSFTGLRVGLAAIKALGEILRKPIVPVSMLEAIALEAKLSENLLSVLDAGRGEVYVGAYDVQDGVAKCLSEQILPIADFSAEAEGKDIVSPDQKVIDALGSRSCVRKINGPRADAIARIGFEKLQLGETVSPEALDATYIRRSEAEIKFAERAK